MTQRGDTGTESQESDLVADLLAGEHRALARVISKIENRSPGYRDLVSELHGHTGHADVIGITGSPGAGKSTLVDKLAKAYRDEGLTVGVIAVDPSSPFSGGAVLGDRIRMASTTGDMDTFFRSMSARGNLGGLSTATIDAVRALDAFGKDKIIVETVGAGQNEIDVIKTVDTVAVLVPPASGDDVQMLKAGILEIGDVFVVNKADLDGADRTVKELQEMIHLEGDYEPTVTTERQLSRDDWRASVVKTVAKTGEGLDSFMEALDDHRAFLEESGQLAEQERTQYAEEIRTLLREDVGGLLEGEIAARGGMDQLVAAIADRETDPYTVAEELLAPIEECLEGRPDDERQNG